MWGRWLTPAVIKSCSSAGQYHGNGAQRINELRELCQLFKGNLSAGRKDIIGVLQHVVGGIAVTGSL